MSGFPTDDGLSFERKDIPPIYESQLNILMIPLDDRPANTHFPETIAKIGGVNLISPPKELLGSYNRKGDVKQIKSWLLENGEKADAFVISTAMMNYEGLFHSRAYDENYLPSIDWLKELHERYPDKKVYVYDIIQRLAPSLMTKEQLDNYYNIGRWAELKGYESLTGPLRRELQELESLIPSEVLQKYIKQRELNHQFKLATLDLVKEGAVDYLILAQGDATEFGIHKLEQKELTAKINELGIDDRVKLLCGADEIDMILISKLMNEAYGRAPSFHLNYINEALKDQFFPYEDRPVRTTIAEHIEAMNSVVVTDSADAENADIEVFVYSDGESRYNIISFAQKIKESLAASKRVAVFDLSTGKYSEDFMKALTDKINLAALTSYSRWNTTSNAIGISLAHSVAKFHCDMKARFIAESFPDKVGKTYLEFNNQLKHETEAHYSFLYERFVKDFIYKNLVIVEAENYITQMGGDFYRVDDSLIPAVQAYILDSMKQKEQNWISGHFIMKFGSYSLDNIRLPWKRAFEVELEIGYTRQ